MRPSIVDPQPRDGKKKKKKILVNARAHERLLFRGRGSIVFAHSSGSCARRGKINKANAKLNGEREEKNDSALICVRAGGDDAFVLSHCAAMLLIFNEAFVCDGFVFLDDYYIEVFSRGH